MANHSSYAQTIIPRFENIGVNDGLSQSSVYSIFQDKQGYMWFGTADGLNRYDGRNLKGYKRHFTTQANSNFIRGNICEDLKGNIWFCNETGIFCYNRQQDSLEVKFSFNKYNQSAGVFIDASGNFWIIHAITGIGQYKISTGTYRHIPFSFKISLQAFVNMHFMVDHDNNIFFRNQKKGGVYRFNSATLQYDHLMAGVDVFAMWMDNNRYCFASDDALIISEGKWGQTRKVPFASGMQIKDVIPDAYGRLWIAMVDSGLVSYDIKTRHFVNYRHSNARIKSLPSDLSTCLFIDRSDNLWIGSDGGGLSRLDLKPPRFNLFPLNEGDYPFLKDYFTRCFFEDQNGFIWFGTHNSGLNKFNPRTGSLRHYEYVPGKKATLPGNLINNLFVDRDQNFWVSGSRGVCIFNEGNNEFKEVPISGIPASVTSNDKLIYCMTQLKNGEILAASFSGLIKFTKDKNGFKGFHFSQPWLNGTMTSIVEMDDGDLWAATPIIGLRHLKITGQDLVETELLFQGLDLRSLHKDELEKTILWICSGNGLIRFNTVTKESKVYDESSGMANSYVYGILGDDNHNYWISTNKGLEFFDRKTNVFHHYSVNDGLQSNEFNTGAFYKGPSGTFYFGGVKGFNWFTSFPSEPKQSFPGVAITSIEINGEPFQAGSYNKNEPRIFLEYFKNNITLEFAALDFTRPAANKIQYQLIGWDKSAIVSGDMNVRYANLSPGSYTLKYKSANSDGKWGTPQVLHIFIQAPFWKREWFYLAMTMALMGSVVLITRSIAQQKLKRQVVELRHRNLIENERHRIGREMHDDIGAGLTQITLMSEAGKRNNTPLKQLDEIGNTSRQLVASISEIIWSMNAENNSPDHLFSYMREQLYKLLEHSGAKYTIDFPAHSEYCALTNEQRRNLLLATKEMVHNAVKHSKASCILVKGTIKDCELEILVEDNGIGFDTSGVFRGSGLRNIENRMKQMSAQLHIVSEINKGSAFKLSLLLNSH